MSNRTLIEINHDLSHNIERHQRQFIDALIAVAVGAFWLAIWLAAVFALVVYESQSLAHLMQIAYLGIAVCAFWLFACIYFLNED